MSAVDDMFGSDSSDGEYNPKSANNATSVNNADLGFDDSDLDNDEDEKAAAAAATGGGSSGNPASNGRGDDPLADSDDDAARPAGQGGRVGVSGTGLSDSDDDGEGVSPKASASSGRDDDLFGSDSDSGREGGGGGGSGGGGGGGGGDDDDDDDPFAEDDGGSGGGGKTLKRLSKGKGKSKAKGGGAGSDKKKKSKGGKTAEDGGSGKIKKKKKKRKRDGEEGGGGGGSSSSSKTKKQKDKKKKSKTGGGGKGDGGQDSDADSLGLGSDSEDEADLDDLEPEEKDPVVGSGDEAANEEARARADRDFIDDAEDDAGLLAEYGNDPPPAGSDSEAEEDNSAPNRFDDEPMPESPMLAVINSMKKHKAQDLSTAERETIAQEFLFKINKAADDDEEAVQKGKPALNKLKLLKLVKATLAKKELQETFLEFDLLGVIKRWLQPYSNGQLPNLTIRSEMLMLVLGLPVQVDHLKRSGIGIVVMGLLKSQQETIENKRVLRQLMMRWNRPIYEKETNYRAMRAIHDEPEAMDVSSSNGRARSGGGARRAMGGGMMQREGPKRDEAIGNILKATKRGIDPTKSRVPFSNGYAFSKAPRSRVEGNSRPPPQQVDTTARTKLLKKMTALSRPVSKGT